VLERLEHRYGSIAAYLEACGLAPEAVARLRERLLV
jgi:hypothetical protein